MRMLGIEFSSSRRCVALWEAAGSNTEAVAVETYAASTTLTEPVALVEHVLERVRWNRQSIDRLAIGLGPGSYTGIRMALAFAQGWHLARPVEIVGLSTLDLLAWQLAELGTNGTFHIAIDAGRNEFCLRTYRLDGPCAEPLGAARLVAPQHVAELIAEGGTVAGPELEKSFPNAKGLAPSALTLCRMGHSAPVPSSPETLAPIYLRHAQFVKAPPTRQW